MEEKDAREGGQGLPENEFSALMQSVGALAPLLGGTGRAQGGGDAPSPGEGARREALLCALKPYLSPARQEAADRLLRLFRIGDALRGFHKGG